MHTRARILQIETQVFRQGLDSGLASIVRGIARRIGNALLRPRNHDCARRGALLERGHEGVEAVNDAEEVRAENLRKR